MLCPDKQGPEVLTPKILWVLMHRKIEERYGGVVMYLNAYIWQKSEGKMGFL
jgi:hypothetical protein